ncbi:MAG: 30S ribosomal protein S12 methylthiotransferase RimO [Phycisphaerae bacterium]|nr:30S ribosomal protein S12 methylthiotransferase RimO [Phycisphaerae bacterium]
MEHASGQSVAIISLGCAKNLVDSERMLALLAEAGYAVAAPLDEADVIVVNTCGFIAPARDESLAAIRQAVALKGTGRAQRVVVAGCLVTRQREALRRAVPGIDAIVGVDDREQIARAVAGDGPATRLSPCTGRIGGDTPRFRLTPRHTAYLRIAEGCSQGCTFCTIPAIRGPFRSRPAAQVLAEAEQLARDGAIELNVIAQDTTGYGRDLPGDWTLAKLLRALDAVDGVRWIRLHYAYPRRFDDALIDAMAGCERVVPYVDLPLQHISDTVLRRMGRGVTRAQTERLLDRLRQRLDAPTIRTTFIVGFPGETDAEFAELLDFVRQQRFDEVGAFSYFAEDGTPAAEMDGQVDAEVIDARAAELIETVDGIARRRAAARVGQRLDVLVDGVGADGRPFARHARQAPEVDSICLLDGPAEPGTVVPGEVTGAEGANLLCRAR